MGWVSRWLRRRARQERPARKVCPALVELETRVVPAGIASSFINHGGPVLDHAQIEVVFYGQGWNSPSAQPAMSQITAFMQYLAGSPFMDTMAQYGVSPAAVTDNVIVPDVLGSTVTAQQIESALSQDIGNGTLRPAGAERLYFVFTAPDVIVTDGSPGPVNFLAYHSSLFDAQNNQDAYAVIPYPGGPNAQVPGLGQFQSLTDVSSHELAEAVTDPYVNAQGNPSGWDDYNFTPGDIGQGEIADIPDGLGAPTAFLNNYAVTELWSNQADAPVAPPGATTPAGTLTVAAQNVNAVAGQPVTAAVATVTDTFANATTADLTATIDWGDGTAPDTNVPVTTDRNGNVVVVGTHTYANVGNYLLTVTVGDAGGNVVTDRSFADVDPAPTTPTTLPVHGVDVAATAGQSFTDVIAVVYAPGTPPGSLSVTVNWGDGTTDSNVQVIPYGPDGRLIIAGTHTYTAAGQDTITVTVTDTANGTAGTATSTATVTAAGSTTTTTTPTSVTDPVPPPVDWVPTVTVLTPQGGRGHHGHHHTRRPHEAHKHR